MILEHGHERTARWDKENNMWDIGDRTKYRWLTSNNQSASDWFNNISEALDWIINYDEKHRSV